MKKEIELPNNDIIWGYTRWLLFLITLQSFGAWFFWSIPTFVVISLAFIVCLILTFVGKKRINYSCCWWFVIYAIAYLHTVFNNDLLNLNGITVYFLKLYPIGIVFMLKPAYKHDFLRILRKGLFYIITISLFFWLLYLIRIPLPNTIINYGILEGNDQYEFQNYFVFLKRTNYVYLFIPRFQSIFIEPGYLGCLLSILLHNGLYKIKGNYENLIFFVALLLTFSLAGYFVTVLGYILTLLSTKNIRFSRGAIFLSFIIGFYIVSQEWNNGNNVLNKLIIDRFQYDKTMGITGNNRSSEETVTFFWRQFVKSEYFWYGGISADRYSGFYNSEQEVSAYVYIMKYGFMAFFFLTLYFFYPVIKYKRHRFSIFNLCFLFFLIFVQTIYMTHSFMYVFLFVLGINEINYLPTQFINKSIA